MATRPPRVRIAGEWHRVAVFQVLTRDPNGRPLTLRLLRDDETVRIKGGEEFILPYVLEDLLNGKRGPN